MSKSKYQVYPTDLSRRQWKRLLPLLPKARSGPQLPGRPIVDRRLVINGLLYLNKTGCQWRMLPKEYGSWNTVYGYFNTWSSDGVWETLMTRLRQKERQRQGRKADPSGACVDSQSVRTATQGQAVGMDGGKYVKGRKRHILVDTLGLLLAVLVTSANTSDKVGLRLLLTHYFRRGVNRLRCLWVDQGYSGTPLARWVASLKKSFKMKLEFGRQHGKGFQLVKKRWVVERTLAWLFSARRNAKDYETLTRNSAAMLQISMISILLRRQP